jgi:oligo-alginate lyase
MALSDDEAWGLMFSPSISRSWMVWSNGHCPTCTNSVPMYRWVINARKHPWKVQCPHCQTFFPKNDFAAFYRSGLDAGGLFDPKRADRTLLFNTEHPEEQDPQRLFGVDDGEGFVTGDKRWRFIGAYLVYGQFKDLVCGGVKALSEAWVLTGDPAYARTAAIILDRVADVYPAFDYAKQGLVYENRGPAGYVSVWHDACEETRELVLAYDQVFEGIRDDPALIKFLSGKARSIGLQNSKSSFADIQRNIEGRLLRDALNSPAKMHSNFPRREVAYTTIQAVLNWPQNREQVESYMDGFIGKATAVDGVTGEKGLSGYASYTINGLALVLAEFSRSDTNFLPRLLKRHPSLRETWRFHIDTLCLDNFYPNSGDCGIFAEPAGRYVGASFIKLTAPRLDPSMFTFFWQLYQATGDAAYVQVLYRENGDRIEGLPHDLYTHDPREISQGTASVIASHGSRPRLGSMHKSGWHIGIMRSGTGKHARALWLDYDAGGPHGHFDAMTIGLFARGMDLLPDFGYPPVQHGGWRTPQVAWYLSPAAHNTVVLDGNKQLAGAGSCTLWADGRRFHAMRAAAPNLVGAREFSRAAVLVDVSDEDFYVIDLFHVDGGSEHTKFMHGPHAEMASSGLTLSPSEPYGRGALMRNFHADDKAAPGWSAEWKLKTGGPAETRMRYTDLTTGVTALTAEANIMSFKSLSPEGFWNPALLTRHTGQAPLQTCFVSTIETYQSQPVLRRVEHLEVQHDASTSCTNGCVGLAFALADGRTDIFLLTAPAHTGMKSRAEMAANRVAVEMTGECSWIRHSADGSPEAMALCRVSNFGAGMLKMQCDPAADLVELEFSESRATVVTGNAGSIHNVRLGQSPLQVR